MTANFILLKLLIDRVDDRDLGNLEQERKQLAKKGAELRRALKLSREQVSFAFSPFLRWGFRRSDGTMECGR